MPPTLIKIPNPIRFEKLTNIMQIRGVASESQFSICFRSRHWMAQWRGACFRKSWPNVGERFPENHATANVFPS
jgi:hypothetical protein